MNTLEESGRVERPTFFSGQQLHASDLRNVVDYHRALRELHNRSLHQAGIGKGLEVSGQRGDRSVTVAPGYAIDSEGHELVLVESQELQIPPVSGTDKGEPVYFDLTISCPNEDDLEAVETRGGLCQTHGTVRLLEEPLLCWVPLVKQEDGTLKALGGLQEAMDSGARIRLARIGVIECKLDTLVVGVRRSARPQCQPRIACGHAHVDWRLELKGSSMTLATSVDTTAAGFLTVPCYMARLAGERLFSITAGENQIRVWLEGLLAVSNGADASGFAVSVAVWPIGVAGEAEITGTSLGTTFETEAISASLLKQFNAAWQVEWIGIE